MLLIDKPAGWTSFDVVAKLRGRLRAQYAARGEKPTKRQLKVGHTGTLDPFATGLLIILRGDDCAHTNEFLKLDKTYEATFVLGKVSSTGDPEGAIEEWSMAKGSRGDEQKNMTKVGPKTPSEEQINDTLRRFTGEIEQTPPAFSAIKINGKRAYELARKGQEVKIPPRRVTIYSLELLSYLYPKLRVRAHVSSGTYIRSLAEDIGSALGTGAYCAELRRTRIAAYDVKDAVLVDEALA